MNPRYIENTDESPIHRDVSAIYFISAIIAKIAAIFATWVRLTRAETQLRETEDHMAELIRKAGKTEALFIASDIGSLFIRYVFEPTYTQACNESMVYLNSF
jgi:hypothetical protein